MSFQEPSRGLIGIRTALTLYAVLIGFAVFTLRGVPLYIALLIILGLAAKAFLHHLRKRLE
ncbi:MAG: hypothetical protein JOY62_07960 [Acidobacteriaceae bacterium]|nr:hypothetical protein [Acidobacteriaceae bacterium]MBV9779895.1 hypothetical protein [Acidobacteriaceae bacterium]